MILKAPLSIFLQRYFAIHSREVGVILGFSREIWYGREIVGLCGERKRSEKRRRERGEKVEKSVTFADTL